MTFFYSFRHLYIGKENIRRDQYKTKIEIDTFRAQWSDCHKSCQFLSSIYWSALRTLFFYCADILLCSQVEYLDDLNIYEGNFITKVFLSDKPFIYQNTKYRKVIISADSHNWFLRIFYYVQLQCSTLNQISYQHLDNKTTYRIPIAKNQRRLY